MLRSLALSLLAGAILAFPAMAQMPRPHLYDEETLDAKLDFLRNLRAKGYASLAKDFTDALIKTATPDQLPVLNLELARTSVALAKEQALSQRLELLDKARTAFEPFIKSEPNSNAGAQARLEMAKLYAIQGSMTLNKALASEEQDEKDKGAKKARDLYDAGDAEFEAAIKTLTALKRDGDVVQAEFDRALNLLEKANTYVNLATANDNRKRAETVDAARKIFEPIAKDHNSANGLLANAYLVKCYQEGQDPSKVNDHYAVVSNATGANAAPALRLAQYYKILYIPKEANFNGDRTKAIIDYSNTWLKTYPAAKKAYEGQHLRFELALVYLQLAGGATKGFSVEDYKKLPVKEKAVVDGHLNAADKIALELKKENGDFSERGSGLNVEIIRINYKLNPLPGKNLDFDTAILRTKLKFQEATKTEDKAKAAKLFNEAQVMLREAIVLGESTNVPTSKIHEAQFMLGSALYAMNDRRRSAIVFESLARANPPSKKGAEAAGFAIELYQKFAKDERDESARYFLRDLGEFILSPAMQKQWSGDPVFGVTRYNLAMDYLDKQDLPAAIEHLSKMPKDFPAFVYSQGQGMFITLQAREAEETPEGKKALTQTAKEFLQRMGPIPADADATTTLMWFNAHMELPKFYYAEAAELLRDGKEKEAGERYAAMGKSIVEIEEAFKKHSGKLAEDRRKSTDFTIKVLNKYSDLGAADIEYRKGNYARVFDDDLLGGMLREVFDIAQKEKGDIKVVDVRVTGEGLSLILRSAVQLNKIDEAKAIYSLLMRIKPVSGEAADNSNFTRSLIKDLADQVDDMKDKKETAKLKSMVGKFTPFGDALAKTLVYDKKNPELIDVKNLIRFYSSLEQYKKAADLIKTVPEPKFLNQKGLKATEEQERDLYIYWDFQVEHGRLLRLSKDWEGANKILGRVINHENARKQLYARMETVHIYEDRDSYGVATKLWKEFMGDLQRAGIGQNKTLQQLYFDAYYYNTICFYKYGQTPAQAKLGKTEAFANLAGQMIVRLQSSKDNLGWSLVGPRFQETMAREKQLKAAYDTALKAVK